MKLPPQFVFPLALFSFLGSAVAGGADLVDPFIGTSGDGNVFPGATLPYSFIQVSPDTGPGSGAGGYKFSKNINGFSQQHISGMGGPVLGEISLLPVTGPVDKPSEVSSTGKSAEAASPGYYTVTLEPWKVKVELSCTSHVAFHRETFPPGADARVLVDVGHVLYGGKESWGSATPVGGEVAIDPAKREVSGWMLYKGGRSTKLPWKVYFDAVFDTPFSSFGTWKDGAAPVDGATASAGNRIGASLSFHPEEEHAVQAKVGISWRSVEQARGHIAAEAPGWDFAAVKNAAAQAWEKSLAKIDVEGGAAEQRKMFYTALYHTHVTPNDWTGEAPERYGNKTYYESLLCLWDTFRTVNPLLTLIEPKVQAGIVNTLLNYYDTDGWTGDSHSAHQYEHVQNGSNADVIIADGYVKNLPGVDWAKAYQAVRKNAFVDNNPEQTSRPLVGRFRLTDYLQYHYLPADVAHPSDLAEHRDNQSVSRTLEYVYDDFCVLTLARKLGTPADIADLQGRLLWYANLWHDGFMHGKMKDGSWVTPFDPLKSETGPQYYEGHAWTWSWYVPHDPQGLIDLLGGDAAFVEKLTTACDKYYQAFNEPCMLETYLFIHAGAPDKTQFFARKALENFTAEKNGLPGNDDSGTTSGWLVWDMLGIYPNAGQDYYYIGSPTFTKATLHLGNGKDFVINAPAASAENKYIAAATLNGKPWDQAWLRHSDLIGGGVLDLTMQAAPSKWGGKTRPPSLTPPHP